MTKDEWYISLPDDKHKEVAKAIFQAVVNNGEIRPTDLVLDCQRVWKKKFDIALIRILIWEGIHCGVFRLTENIAISLNRTVATHH
jgi:hypothetical protein